MCPCSHNQINPGTVFYVVIEVRGMPNGIFHPWVRWDSGVEVAGKFFRRRRRRRRRPPQKWVFGDYRFPSCSDT